MNSTKSIKSFCRWVKPSYSPKRWLSEIQKPSTPPTPPPPSQTSETPLELVRVGNMRKRLWVLAGLYKNINNVPDLVSNSTFSRNMDRFRVRASIMLMVLSGLGSLSSIMLAKSTLIDIEEDRDKRG